MKSFIFLLSMISLAQLISSKTPQEEKLSETIKALEGHLLYYYIHEKKNPSQRYLNPNSISR